MRIPVFPRIGPQMAQIRDHAAPGSRRSIATVNAETGEYIENNAEEGSTSSTNKPRPGFYQLLQVSPGASQRRLKEAYYKLAKKYHPDVVRHEEKKNYILSPEEIEKAAKGENSSSRGNTHEKNLREEVAVEINFSDVREAYSVLSNPGMRRLYDLEIRRSDRVHEFHQEEEYSREEMSKFEAYKRKRRMYAICFLAVLLPPTHLFIMSKVYPQNFLQYWYMLSYEQQCFLSDLGQAIGIVRGGHHHSRMDSDQDSEQSEQKGGLRNLGLVDERYLVSRDAQKWRGYYMGTFREASGSWFPGFLQ